MAPLHTSVMEAMSRMTPEPATGKGSPAALVAHFQTECRIAIEPMVNRGRASKVNHNKGRDVNEATVLITNRSSNTL